MMWEGEPVDLEEGRHSDPFARDFAGILSDLVQGLDFSSFQKSSRLKMENGSKCFYVDSGKAGRERPEVAVHH